MALFTVFLGSFLGALVGVYLSPKASAAVAELRATVKGGGGPGIPPKPPG